MVERKNRILDEMARTMLYERNLPKYFWTEAINTACYILHRALIRPILKKTPYEVWNNRKTNISYFCVFGCKCFIYNNGKDNLENFNAKSDEDILLGYSTFSKAYRVFNKTTLIFEKSIHIAFNESNKPYLGKNTKDDECILENEINVNETSTQEHETHNLEETSREHQDQELSRN